MPILLAIAFLSQPPAILAEQLCAAIWNDLQRNAWIGNGNWSAALWYNASWADAEVPDLHIWDLACEGTPERQRCSFTLLRDGGVRLVLGEAAPDRLDCTAELIRSKTDGWSVKHLPPRGSGHSRTDMQCNLPAKG